MKLMKSFSIAILGVLFVTNSFAAKKNAEPAWVKNPDADYPETAYIKALGTGASEEIAKSKALSEVSQYFRTKIQTNTVADSQLSQVSDGTSTNTKKSYDIETVVRTSSETTLQGVKYSTTYFDKKEKTYYSIAYIDRNIAFSSALNDFENTLKTFNSHFKMAKSLENVNPIKAIESYNNADKSTIDLLVKRSICNVIKLNSPEVQKYENDIKNALSINALISKCKRNCTVFVDISEKEDCDHLIQTILEKKIKSKGFIISPTKENAVYIADVDVQFNTTNSNNAFVSRPSIRVAILADSESIYDYEENIGMPCRGSDEYSSKLNATKKLVESIDLGFEF